MRLCMRRLIWAVICVALLRKRTSGCSGKGKDVSTAGSDNDNKGSGEGDEDSSGNDANEVSPDRPDKDGSKDKPTEKDNGDDPNDDNGDKSTGGSSGDGDYKKTPPANKTDDQGLGAGWFQFTDSKAWYRLGRDKDRMTYAKAKDYCTDLHKDARLLEVYSKNEYEDVRNKMIRTFEDYKKGHAQTGSHYDQYCGKNDRGYCDVYWLGANDIEKEMGNKEWPKWESGKDITYNAWAHKDGKRKQPDDSPPKGKNDWEKQGEDCLVMTLKEPGREKEHTSYGWNDMVCDGKVRAKKTVECCFAACRYDEVTITNITNQ